MDVLRYTDDEKINVAKVILQNIWPGGIYESFIEFFTTQPDQNIYSQVYRGADAHGGGTWYVRRWPQMEFVMDDAHIGTTLHALADRLEARV